MMYTRKNISLIPLGLMFFYVYNVTFVFFPIPVLYIYGFFGFCLLIIQKSFIPCISKKFTNYCWLYALLYLFSFISIIINNTYDLIFLRNISAYIFYIFASIFLLTFTKSHIKKYEDIIRYFCWACTIQALITLFSFFSPVIKDLVRNIQIYNEVDAEKYEILSYRAFGLGSWFDIGSMRFGVALIFIQYLYLREKKIKIYYFLIFFIILAAGILTARTILVGFGFSALYLFFAPKQYRKKKLFAIIIVLLIILSFVVLIFLFFPSLIEQFDKTIKWAFRVFFSISDGGRTRVGSLDTLFGKMYFFPDSLKTWFIGDGIINSPDGSYYMHTDAGYMRFLLFFGFFGLLFYICYQTYMAIVMFKKDENILLKYLKYFLLLYILVCFIKTRINIAFVASLFFVLNYMQSPEIKLFDASKIVNKINILSEVKE